MTAIQVVYIIGTAAVCIAAAVCIVLETMKRR